LVDQVENLRAYTVRLQGQLDAAEGKAQKNSDALDRCMAQLDRIVDGPTASTAPGSSGSGSEPSDGGRVRKNSGDRVRLEGDTAIASGSVSSTADTTLTATVSVDLFDGDDVLDFSSVTLDVGPGEKQEWEVEFVVGEDFKGRLSVKSYLEQ